MGGCGGLESDFERKELILNTFNFGRVSTLGGCGGLERTDFEHFLLREGMVGLKELILNTFYFFGRV